MRLPKLAIDNYQFVLVLVFLALSTGVLSFMNMPRSEDPTLDFPVYSVIAIYPGTSPQDIEDLVVDPIEKSLNELEDLTEIRSNIQNGLAVISIEGEFGIDTDDLFDEVNAQVTKVRGDMPENLQSLEVIQQSPQNVAIYQMALISPTVPYRELVDHAERLENRLKKISGVRTIDIEGYPEEEIRIDLDFEKMGQLQLSLNQVSGILRGNNANIPGGEIKAGSQSFSLKTSGGYQSVEELTQTVVGASQGKLLYLKDISKVYATYEDPNYIARYNGQRAIFVSITQKKGVNILQLSASIQQQLDAFTEQLPPNIELAVAFEQAPAVKSRVNDFFMNLLQGIFLVGIVISIFLGIRNALIIMTVIPTSILIAINLLDVSGFGIQQISIAGLVIALGLLVDNGIVVVENISRLIREGKSVREAAVQGTSEVGWAIVSSTMTTILAFFPMTQLGGGTGQFIKTMPIIVMFSLIASLILALILSPLLADRLLKPALAERLTATERALQWMVQKVYRRALNFSLTYPLVVVGIALLSLAGSAALFPLVGVSFFPSADKPMLVINIDTPKGSNLDRTDEAAAYVEHQLEELSFVAGYSTNVGHGNPQIYYNIIPKNTSNTHAQIIVELKEWKARSFYQQIETLRSLFADYPGAKIRVVELKNGPPYEAPIAIKVIGDEASMLKTLAAKVEQIIASTQGSINVDNPLSIGKTQLRAHIHREKAGMLGVPLIDIDMALRTALSGNNLGSLNFPDGSDYELVVRMDNETDMKISDFQKVYLSSMSGAQIPLSQLVELKFEAEAAQIDHFDLERTATVTSDVKDGYSSNLMTREIIAQLDGMNWPDGYGFYVSGEFETQQESFGDLGQLLAVAVLGIFAVLILQFKSFRQPFIVLSAIPLAVTGSILALFVTGHSFSFLAFVGFTSLVGIVVNTSIILVDYANQLRLQGMETGLALRLAAETRFIPILLTTLTTILGLLPLTLSGGNLWPPMGWSIIGGMISSTLLTLLIVPILYQWLTKVPDPMT
ncbi:MAG: efflux RND transporter permease subunit [Bacteroidota bacterium]